MGKGYAEGPAAEAAQARIDALERPDDEQPPIEERSAVYGCTEDEPERHFLGWVGEVDPDELFASGTAWGLAVVRTASAREALR